MPEPGRTAGGHRLYSQRDIDTIKWLIARQDEGLSISKAVKLWHSLLDEGHDPLYVPAYQTADTTSLPAAATSSLTEIRQSWIDACLKFDEPTAEQVLIQAFAIYPVAMVCTEVLQKGLATIGDLWYGRIPGHFLGKELADSMQTVGKILTFNPPGPSARGVKEGYERAATVYRHHRIAIEAEIWQLIGDSLIPAKHFSLANMHLSENIMAALQLGDMAYLVTETDWVYQLLANHDLPQNWLQHYLNAYYKTADKHLNDAGRPIINWLDEIRNKYTIAKEKP